MGSIGLVLGGGGVTGAAFHFGTLFSLQMATGWDPASADVIVGTSSGAVVASILRGGTLDLQALVGDADHRAEMAEELSQRIYRRARPRGVFRWLRHGVVPSIARPGVQFALGSPAPYTADGIADWVEDRIGPEAAASWPDRPTLIVAYELEARRRIAFGSVDSPDTSIATAVAASAAVPMIYEPVVIDGKRYVDGGVASGTSVDLLLGADRPLDLVIVIAPMASQAKRPKARFYEGLLDRLGGTALTAELELLAKEWPQTDVVVLRPDEMVLEAARPNPLSCAAAVPSFLRTLRSMRRQLAEPDCWEVLERHLMAIH